MVRLSSLSQKGKKFGIGNGLKKKQALSLLFFSNPLFVIFEHFSKNRLCIKSREGREER